MVIQAVKQKNDDKEKELKKIMKKMTRRQFLALIAALAGERATKVLAQDPEYRINLPIIFGPQPTPTPTPPPLPTLTPPPVLGSGVAIFDPDPDPDDYPGTGATAVPDINDLFRITAGLFWKSVIRGLEVPEVPDIRPQGLISIPILNDGFEDDGESWTVIGDVTFSGGKAYLGSGAILTQLVRDPTITPTLLRLYAYMDPAPYDARALISLYAGGRYASQAFQGNPGYCTVLDTYEARNKLVDPGAGLWVIVENIGSRPFSLQCVFGDWWQGALPPIDSPYWDYWTTPGDGRICMWRAGGDPVCVSRWGAWLPSDNPIDGDVNYITLLSWEQWQLAQKKPGVILASPLRQTGAEVVVFVLVAPLVIVAGALMVTLLIDEEEVLIAIEDVFGDPDIWWDNLDEGVCVGEGTICAYKSLVQVGGLWVGSWVTERVLIQLIDRVDPLAPTLETNWWWSKNHEESERIGQALAELLETGYTLATLSTKGDGRSNGSIQIKAGGKDGWITFGVAHIASSEVNYFAFRVARVPAGTSGAYQIPGTGWYYLPLNFWESMKCAWTMSAKIGHSPQPPPLTVGKGGYARWLQLCELYGLIVDVATIYFAV